MNLLSEVINKVITLEEKKRSEVIQKAKDRAGLFNRKNSKSVCASFFNIKRY